MYYSDTTEPPHDSIIPIPSDQTPLNFDVWKQELAEGKYPYLKLPIVYEGVPVESPVRITEHVDADPSVQSPAFFLGHIVVMDEQSGNLHDGDLVMINEETGDCMIVPE